MPKTTPPYPSSFCLSFFKTAVGITQEKKMTSANKIALNNSGDVNTSQEVEEEP